MAGLRVVLDTNVLVSRLAYPGSVPGRIVGIWRQGGLDVVLSRYILDEMVRVLPRLSRIHLSSSEISLRDAADQQVLATLRASKADYLITGDKDLLALAEKYPIVPPRHFGRGMAEELSATRFDDSEIQGLLSSTIWNDRPFQSRLLMRH